MNPEEIIIALEGCELYQLLDLSVDARADAAPSAHLSMLATPYDTATQYPQKDRQDDPTDRQEDSRPNEQTDRRTDGQTDKQPDKKTTTDRKTDKQTNRQTDRPDLARDSSQHPYAFNRHTW